MRGPAPKASAAHIQASAATAFRAEVLLAASTMRSMRRSGSAAPHSSWSPTVKAARYSPPIGSLRKRPIGTVSVPVTAAGVSSRSVDFALVRNHLHPLVGAGEDALDLVQRDIARQLEVSAWLWQRMAPTRTHTPSTGTGLRAAEDLVGLGHALPFFAALAVAEILVDPGKQTAGERLAEAFHGERGAAQRLAPRCGRCR